MYIFCDTGNFDDSFTVDPIRPSNSTKNKGGKAKTKTKMSTGASYHSNRDTLGVYESLSLRELIWTGFGMEYENYRDEVSGEAVLVAGIDLDSGVLEIGEKFKKLFDKYIGIDVCFIGISGQKEVGKSFFCDKVLNLAEVKGNNFSQVKLPGLYTFSSPFVKDGLHIFLLEISGCDVNSEAFRLLNTIALFLSSSYLYISGNNQKDSEVCWGEFCRALESNLSNFYLEENTNSKRQTYFPSSFYFASRQENQGNFVPILKSQVLLNNPESVYLPNAMTAGYKGNKSDLNSVSFLARECINPEYMKSIFGIFKKLYDSVEEKRYNELIVNGNIALKILQNLIITLNSHKKIQVESVYKNIIEELYVSAFNFCILSYHGELEEYFEDEQPKNTDEMLSKFESASENALEKFNEFNLNRELHDEYEKKLLEHFDSKESLICSINKQKTQEVLEREFARIDQSKTSFKDAFNILKNTRKELDDGRAEALQQKLSQIFVTSCSGPDLEQMKKIEFLEDELSKWRNRYEKEREKKNIFEENQRKIKELLKEEQDVNSRIHKLEEQTQSLLEKQRSLKNGEQQTEALAKKQSEYQKSLQLQQKTQENLSNLQNESSELAEKGIREKYEAEISQVTKRAKEVEKELLELHHNEKLASTGEKVEKKSKPKEKSNLNENQVNKSDLKNSEQNKSGVKKSEVKKSKK